MPGSHLGAAPAAPWGLFGLSPKHPAVSRDRDGDRRPSRPRLGESSSPAAVAGAWQVTAVGGKGPSCSPGGHRMSSPAAEALKCLSTILHHLKAIFREEEQSVSLAPAAPATIPPSWGWSQCSQQGRCLSQCPLPLPRDLLLPHLCVPAALCTPRDLCQRGGRAPATPCPPVPNTAQQHGAAWLLPGDCSCPRPHSPSICPHLCGLPVVWLGPQQGTAQWCERCLPSPGNIFPKQPRNTLAFFHRCRDGDS